MKLIRLFIITLILGGFLFTSCKKDCDTHPISVDAGLTQTVQLPTNSATLSGTVKSGLTANTNYLWTLVSGPGGTPIFAHDDSATTLISGLIAGTYVFQFQATNSYGMTGFDTTSIVVLPRVPATLVLQPADNPYEGDINVHSADNWLSGATTQLYIEAWTDLGAPFTGRVAIKFDYTALPSYAVIDSASLYLYAPASPNNGDKIHAHQGPTNAFYIQRLISNWVLPSPFTWNAPPTVTTSNEVLVPQSITDSDNLVADVTALVKDQQTFGNNGFFMALQNEVTYNIRQYESSYYSDSTQRPKLIIHYH